MKKTHFISVFAAILTLSAASAAHAQDGLIAFHEAERSQIATVDDEILEAMKTLDEVSDLIHAAEPEEKVRVDEGVELAAHIQPASSFKVDDLIKEAKTTNDDELPDPAADTAQNRTADAGINDATAKAESDNTTPEPPVPDSNAATPAPETPETVQAINEDKIEAPHAETAEAPVAEPQIALSVPAIQPETPASHNDTAIEQTDPKYNLQTAPVIEDNTSVAVNTKAEAKAAEPKYNLQTAPVIEDNTSVAVNTKAEANSVASKHSLQTVPAKTDNTKVAVNTKAEANSVASKHDLQTAPAKTDNTKVAVNTKAEANSVAPKHNLQTAPAKTDNTKVAVNTKAEANSIAPRHNLQTAPAKTDNTKVATNTKAEANSVAPKHNLQTASSKSVIKTTTKTQAGHKAPDLNPKSQSHNLSLEYVTANYKANDVDLTKADASQGNPTIGQLYQYAFSRKLVYQSTKPAVGDLVFFHNTVDRNGDSQWNDWHTLVGIVEAVNIDGNQTISILTWRTDKLERILLNLKYPELYKSRKGKVLNSQLRPDQGNNKGTSAKLFAGFANLLGDKTTFNLIDNWKPGMK